MREDSAQGLTMRPDKRLQHFKEYHLGVIYSLLYTFTTAWCPKTTLEGETQGKVQQILRH